MKKLLSAVTSFAMSASLMTSAFAPSVYVSAAGSVPVAQPNVSMGEVLDVSAKTADGEHTPESEFTPVDDFIIDLNNGGAGYTFTIDELKEKNTFNISAVVQDMGSHKSAKLIAKPGTAPDGFTIVARTTNYAYNNAVWELNGETYYCNTMNADGDSDVIGSEKPVMAFQVTVDVDAVKPGTYTYNFARFDVAEDGTGQKEISPLVIPAVITIEGDEPEVVTTTTTEEPTVVTTTTTEQVKPVEGAVTWDILEVEATQGETVEVPVQVKNGSLEVAGAQFGVDAKSPVEFAGISGKSDAYKSDIVNSHDNTEFAFGEGVGKGVTANIGDNVFVLTYNVPADCPAGEYPVEWASNAFISDTNGNDITSKVTLDNGKIIVKAKDTPAAEGAAEWVIPDVTAKPGETVKMDVTVKNSTVPVAGAQFTIDNDAQVTYDSISADSAAYKSAIIHNNTNKEFAFGEGVGKGVTANNGDTVFTLTYQVPAGCPAGTYPVTWGKNAFISDTNGNDITSQVTLTNGSITVENDVTKASGEVEWIIPTVTAKAGDTVTMDVTVKGGALAVAGAQFAIENDAKVTYDSISSNSTAYKSAIVHNNGTQEFAFGEGVGKGVAANENDVVFTLTYKVPADCPAGTYPVTWGENAFISDTNGLDVTSQVKLTDGAIVIEAVTTTTTTTEAPAEGEVEWVIPTVTAKAGDTVTMDVTVKGGSLAVAGAQFSIEMMHK